MGQSISSEGKKILDAVEREDAEAVRTIASARPEAVLQKTWWKRKTPLMIACEKGNVLIASTILWASEQALGPQYLSYVNDASSSGSTALVLACKYGHAALVRVLLEEGASPLSANRRGLTAAHVAAHFGHAPCLELVLDAPVRALGGGAPLAAQAPILDQAGETRFIDAHDRAGFSPLHLAAISRASTAVAALVQRGAALDTPVLRGLERLPFLAGGSTPLHIAASQGDARTCAALLDGQRRHPGLELRRVRNMLGLTPLNCALLSGHHDVVRLLVDSSRRSSAAASASSVSQFVRIPHSHHARSLSAAFPESLRSHMMAVLQRASLLLQLRQIAGGWRAAGAERPSDAAVCSLPGLDSLSLPQIKRLQRLLRRQDTSLREVLFRLESALHRGRGRHRAPGGAAGELDSDSDGSDDETTSIDAGDAAAGAEIGGNAAGVDWTVLSQTGRRGRRRQSSRAATEERCRSTSASVRAPGTGLKSDARSSASDNAAGAAAGAPHTDATTATAAAAALGLPPPDEDCMICYDHAVEVGFAPCHHSLCFQCACRLCVRGSEITTCPFCRTEVQEVEALVGARKSPPLKQAPAAAAAIAHVGGQGTHTAVAAG